MNCKKISFSGHATKQMFERSITESEVISVIEAGTIIKEYPDDKPYPSYLILGIVKKRVLHVVLSKDKNANCYVITAYEPDSKIWNIDFKTKK